MNNITKAEEKFLNDNIDLYYDIKEDIKRILLPVYAKDVDIIFMEFLNMINNASNTEIFNLFITYNEMDNYRTIKTLNDTYVLPKRVPDMFLDLFKFLHIVSETCDVHNSQNNEDLSDLCYRTISIFITYCGGLINMYGFNKYDKNVVKKIDNSMFGLLNNTIKYPLKTDFLRPFYEMLNSYEYAYYKNNTAAYILYLQIIELLKKCDNVLQSIHIKKLYECFDDNDDFLYSLVNYLRIESNKFIMNMYAFINNILGMFSFKDSDKHNLQNLAESLFNLAIH